MTSSPSQPTLDFYRRDGCEPCDEARSALQAVMEDRAKTRRSEPSRPLSRRLRVARARVPVRRTGARACAERGRACADGQRSIHRELPRPQPGAHRVARGTHPCRGDLRRRRLVPLPVRAADSSRVPRADGRRRRIGRHVRSSRWLGPPAPRTRWQVIPHAIAFVLGFTLVFTVLGLTFYAFRPLFDLPPVRIAGGLLVIVLGLNLMGVLANRDPQSLLAARRAVRPAGGRRRCRE